MIGYLTLLLGCQLLGEVFVRLLGLPIPGPLVGMLLLLVGLMVRGRVPPQLETVSGGFLRNLSVLYVPVGVGIVVHFDTLSKALGAIAGATIVGTLVTMALTGILMQRLSRKTPIP